MQVKAKMNLMPYRYCGAGSLLTAVLSVPFASAGPGAGEGTRSFDVGVVEPVVSAILRMFPMVCS